MKIAFNPSNSSKNILDLIKTNKDIIFDLKGHSIYARGVEFKGTDTNTWRDIKINNVSIDSNILDLRNGSNTTLTNINGVVTINSTQRPVVDNLTSNSTTSSLSANQGRVLAGLINSKSDSGHTHDGRYVRSFGTTNDNIDSDWGQSFKTFDPIPSGTPPEKNPNISLLSIGENFNRRKQLAFVYSSDNIYYRRHTESGFSNWRRLAYANEIPSSLKNPYALTISLNGTSQGPYDGSATKNINITPGSIGAAASDHNHDGRYVRYYTVTTLDCNNLAAGLTAARVNATNAGAAYHSAYLYISDVGTPFQIQIPDSDTSYIYKRYYSSGKWSGWFKLNAGYADSAGFASRLEGGSTPEWGTLTAANGFTNVSSYDYDSRGAYGLCGKNNALYMQLDGYFYQSEGRYRVLDTSDVAGLKNDLTVHQFLSNTDGNWYPLIWGGSDHRNTNDSTGGVYKSYDKLCWQTSSQTLYATKLWSESLTTGSAFFIPGTVKDATLKIYSGRITDGVDDGHIGLQTSIDSTDGETHIYPTQHGPRCVLALQPRGGSVYIGNMPNGGNGRKLNVHGDIGLLNIGSIKDLAIGGGIFWNPNVESATDGSDAASITVVKAGVAGGTTLVLSQMNDANDTIQFKTNTAAKLYHNSYPILTTQNTYVSNNKGYINGTEITQVNNADTVDGEHASNFSYTHQASFNFATIKNGRIVTFDQSDTAYGWINGFASTHNNYLTSVLFNAHRTADWYVGYMEGNTSTGKTNGLLAVHKLAFVDQIPTSLKNPHSLTLKANGTTLAIYDGSSAKEANFTYANVGAASASHYHTYIVAEDLRYKYPAQILDPCRMKLSFLAADTLGIENNGTWYDVITVRSYGDSSGGHDNALLFSKNTNSLYHTSFAFGTTDSWGSPLLIIDSGNIGSQTVSNAYHLYINSANSWSTWYWAGQSGQPSWLWGSNDGTNMYLWNPSNFNVHTAQYLRSLGNQNCQTGRTQSYGDVYTYNTYDGNTGSPTTYSSVIGFGRGTGGTVEIAGGWCDTNLYWRSLRDCCEDWYSWRTVLDSDNYTEFIGNYYWANVKVSPSPSTTTSPTVYTLTATRVCAGHNPGIDNSISCSNWFRSSGATGWYNTTYEGGWYMSDTSWIRAHNDVGIYTGGQIYSSSSIRMSNIYLEHTDEINSTSGINLNYRNSSNASLCYGGGNVGIGTMSPTQRLDVVGNIRATGQIIREGSSQAWINGRNGALLRETSVAGYHTLWSLKTTDGSWDFGEYNAGSYWNNIPVLSYITDSDYNSGNNTPTYQIKFPLASGTVALTSDIPDISTIPNPTNCYWANVKISTSANTHTAPSVNTIFANNWFRSQGDTGWYNETYEGGIHMTDTKWIRTFGGKSFYCDSQISSYGFHHLNHDNNDAILLAGGGYKTLNSIYGGDDNHPVFLGYLNLDHGYDGTIGGSFSCLGYTVSFTYTRGGNYCRIRIPDTTYQTFYIKAAIAQVHYSGGGMDTWTGINRGQGAWWLHCYASSSNEVRVKGFCQRNAHNDSWWGGNPLYSYNDGANRITVCIFGYVKFK